MKDPEIQVLNGRWGTLTSRSGKGFNFKNSKKGKEAETLTYAETH